MNKKLFVFLGILLFTKMTSAFAAFSDENGHEYVDLGLSVKWATCNVGADSPEDYGDYFAWGETEPKSTYNKGTYKWYTGLPWPADWEKYDPDDKLKQLELRDDAARANWGGSWRMPTERNWEELNKYCKWTWTTKNGVNGYKVTSKINGNSIFLPAAGYRHGSSLKDAGEEGYYWSCLLSQSVNWYPAGAEYEHFDSDPTNRFFGASDYRWYGLSVRPVCL